MKGKLILGQAILIGQYLFGGSPERRQFIMKETFQSNPNDNQTIVLPVTPNKYKLQTAQSNKTVEILDTGEALLFGNSKLKRLSFDSFFPALKHEYPFVVGDEREPEEFINILTRWKEAKQPIQVIITDSPVNLQMAIMSFNLQERDGTRDIYYDLDLTEYRDLNTKMANNQQTVNNLTGLRERNNTAQDISQKQSFVDKARDVVEKAKYAYGTFNQINKFKSVNGIGTVISSVKKGLKW